MEWIASILNFITENVAQIAQVIGAFAVLATMTPNKADDKIAQVILDIVNFLGGNTGRAKNDPAKE